MNKLKILVIGPKEYPFGSGSRMGELPGGGTDRFFDNLTKSMNSERIEFHLVTQKYSGSSDYEKSGNHFIYRVNWVRGKYRVLTYCLFAFFRSLRIEFDKVFTILEPPLIFGYLLSKLKRKKLVCRLGGFSDDKHLRFKGEYSLIRKIDKFVLPKADRIFLASEREKNYLQDSLGIKLDNIEIIKTGITKINTTRKVITSKIKTILYVGRLERVKGVDILITAASKLKNVQLWILGTGREEKNLKYLASKLNIRKKVKFWGFREDIDNFFSYSDIFVLPSRSEGTPHSLLEAMSAAIPIVVSDIGFDEVVDGHSALFFNSEDSDSLSDKIKILLSDKNLQERLSSNSRQSFYKNHSIEKMASEYSELLISV